MKHSFQLKRGRYLYKYIVQFCVLITLTISFLKKKKSRFLSFDQIVQSSKFRYCKNGIFIFLFYMRHNNVKFDWPMWQFNEWDIETRVSIVIIM